MSRLGDFLKRPAQRLDQFFIAHDVECLLQRFEIVGTDENERSPTVAADKDAIMLVFDAVCHLREMRLYFGERECGHGGGSNPLFQGGQKLFGTHVAGIPLRGKVALGIGSLNFFRRTRQGPLSSLIRQGFPL